MSVSRSRSRKSHDCIVTNAARPLKGGNASSPVSLQQAGCKTIRPADSFTGSSFGLRIQYIVAPAIVHYYVVIQ